jgi:ABC-type transport system involved in cytochrome c biogenesis permease component
MLVVTVKLLLSVFVLPLFAVPVIIIVTAATIGQFWA